MLLNVEGRSRCYHFAPIMVKTGYSKNQIHQWCSWWRARARPCSPDCFLVARRKTVNYTMQKTGHHLDQSKLTLTKSKVTVHFWILTGEGSEVTWIGYWPECTIPNLTMKNIIQMQNGEHYFKTLAYSSKMSRSLKARWDTRDLTAKCKGLVVNRRGLKNTGY